MYVIFGNNSRAIKSTSTVFLIVSLNTGKFVKERVNGVSIFCKKLSFLSRASNHFNVMRGLTGLTTLGLFEKNSVLIEERDGEKGNF